MEDLQKYFNDFDKIFKPTQAKRNKLIDTVNDLSVSYSWKIASNGKWHLTVRFCFGKHCFMVWGCIDTNEEATVAKYFHEMNCFISSEIFDKEQAKVKDIKNLLNWK